MKGETLELLSIVSDFVVSLGKLFVNRQQKKVLQTYLKVALIFIIIITIFAQFSQHFQGNNCNGIKIDMSTFKMMNQDIIRLDIFNGTTFI